MKTDSIYTLPEVEKVESISNVIHKVAIYSTSTSRNLSDVLKENTGIYLKNYGNGQLSSIAFRGTGAEQTDVLWNGIKMNSPSLGQVDASLFNLGMADRIEVKGIAQSGNVGGELNLQDRSSFDSTLLLEANFTYGSFNTFRTFGKALYSNYKFYGVTRVSYLSSDNNYPFIDSFQPGNPKEKMSNAKVRLLNFMQQFGAKIKERNSFHFNLWLSDAQRQIPPIISKEVSRQSQDDYSLRSMLAWKGQFKRISSVFTTAFFQDEIHYRDPEIYLDQKSIMQAFRNNLLLKYDSLNKILFETQVGFDFERAIVPSYGNNKIRLITKLSTGVQYQPIQEISLRLNLREQLADKSFSPFSPSLNFVFAKRLKQNMVSVFTSVSRNFRFPTLNDLYWVPGGNQNLKMEKSWDGELGMRYQFKSNFSLKATGFCKYVTNWIQWTPDGANWQAQNLKRVLTSGVEITANYFYTKNQYEVMLSANYTFTAATNLDAIFDSDQSKYKQLIYVPYHVANANLYFEFKNYFFRAVNTYTGQVFITTDNSQSLAGYYLLDLEVGENFIIKNLEVGCSFRVNNVTNKQYQSVAQKPMPGRSFEGTFSFKFNQ